MLLTIIAIATVMTLYFVGCLIKIALEDKDVKQHREDFNRVMKEVEEYRKLHRDVTQETNAFGYDGLLYRVNRG